MATPTQKIFSWIETLLSITRVLISSEFTTKWLIKKRTDRINILGNGPSLREIEADILKGDIMAVNNFALTEKFELFKPCLYILNAPEYWIKDVDDEYIVTRRNLAESIFSKVTWEMALLVPAGARKSEFVLRISRNPMITIQYYNTVPTEGLPGICHILYDKKLGMPRPHNVLIPAIMTSVWSGYTSIFLYGADHSWLKDLYVSEDNMVFLTQKHFYDFQSASPAVMKKLGKGSRKIHEIIEKFYLAFKGYHEIYAYAVKKGVTVFNCTRDSYIDAFPRKLS
jgi:hypothetical protein